MVVPPNIEQLREARAWWDDTLEDATYIPEYIPEYDDAVSDAIDFLLSLADSGGRLVVETPCEHGNTSPHYFDDDMISFEDWGDYIRCDRDDCALEHVRPGKVQCECDSHGTPYDTGFGPQGGERKPSCPGGSRHVVWPTDKEEGSAENKVSAETQRDLYACPPSCECEGGGGDPQERGGRGMSETPRELLVWKEFVASDGYVFGSGVRSATDDEIRAAVIPLLNYEAAKRVMRSWLVEDNDAPLMSAVKLAVDAALGIGKEESSDDLHS